MKNTCLLSQDAKNYLCCYYQTLDGMIQAMTTANLTQSISHNFIVQMTPHHRAAVQMATNVLRFTENNAVRCLAQSITDQRAQGIEDMEAALPACGVLTNPTMDLRLYQRRMDLIYREMYAGMGSTPENDRLAALYLAQMIPHCRGAVRMAENALKYDVSTELVPILRAIAVRQRREVSQMRALLSRMGCQQR